MNTYTFDFPLATPTPTSEIDLGTRINNRLKELGLSQIDLAEVVSKSQGWVSQVLIRNAEKTLLKFMVEDLSGFESLVADIAGLLQ